MTSHKFGKSLLDILDIKQSFFAENDAQLAKILAINEIYIQQPERKKCKLCRSDLPAGVYFSSHGVSYKKCPVCSHINGTREDTEEFAAGIYIDGEYALEYRDSEKEKYKIRVEKIYAPKAKFLLDSVRQCAPAGFTPRILDVGAGSGHMVCALRDAHQDCIGIEVSERQVEYGNLMIGGAALMAVKDPRDIIGTTDRNVLTTIGVLEHIHNLQEVLEAIVNNSGIQYWFLSVPCHSLTCAWEACLPGIFPRHLGGGHTHIFTRESLQWMYNALGFAPAAVWDFGSDIMDLFRSTVVGLKMSGASDEMIEEISLVFKKHGDAMQSILDHAEFCTETHVLLERR